MGVAFRSGGRSFLFVSDKHRNAPNHILASVHRFSWSQYPRRQVNFVSMFTREGFVVEEGPHTLFIFDSTVYEIAESEIQLLYVSLILHENIDNLEIQNMRSQYDWKVVNMLFSILLCH